MVDQSTPIELLHIGSEPDASSVMTADESSESFDHRTAATVADAIEISTTDAIDCVLVSADRPEIDVIELLSELRRRTALLPVICIAGEWDDDTAQRIIDHGGTDFIVTAGHTTDWRELLIERIHDAVDHYHTQRTLEIDDRALRTERTRFEKLFEGSRDCIAFTEYINGEPIIRRLNPAFETVFGYEPETAIGKSLDDLIVPTDRRTEAQSLNEATLDAAWVEREVTRETAAGEQREFLFRGMQVTTQTGAIEGYPIYTDITDRKQREQELQQQNDRLDEFAGIVSHDLRNPLNIAKGHLDLARENHESDHLDAVARAHDRMESMIEELLALAREGDISPTTTAVDLADLTEASWQAIGTEEATLVIETTQTVQADEHRLQQLLENLLRNAVEHGGSDVTVTVGSLSDGFYVEDNGPGIAPDRRDRIFERGTSTAHSGAGFGLRIVNQIVNAHGWTIRVETGTDGGARFEIAGIDDGGVCRDT